MLTQWKYKIVQKFTIDNGEIHGPEVTNHYLHTKPRPDGVFLYKPTKKGYDYVDYTGCGKHEDVDISDKTFKLEILGYIKYVSRRKCDDKVV